MDENTLFRSALHGFKREDVMDYITKTARQSEAALADLQGQLDEARTQLDGTCAELEETRAQLEEANAELEKLSAEHRDFEALKAQLNEVNQQAAMLQLQLRECDERHVSEMETVRNAGLEALKQYQEDADGYAVLAAKVGQIMLRAENTGEAIRIHAQEEADSALEAAKAQAEALLADAREQADAMLADAQSRVAAAQEEADALRAEIQSLFRQGRERFEAAQQAVSGSVSSALAEVDQVRSILLELTAFNHAEAPFSAPDSNGGPDSKGPEEELVSVGE